MNKIKDIVNIIEEFAPLYLQEDFDNSGLQIGDAEGKVTKVLITLDVDLCVIDEAISKGAELIISHHPIIFNPIKSVTLDNINGKLIAKAIKNNIAIYSAHTNVDNAPESIAKEIGNKLKCKNIIALDFTCGIQADLAKESIMRDFITELSEVIGDNKIKSIGNLNEKVNSIIFANGANGGNEELLLYAYENADILITSELKHHIAVLAKQMNYKIIECGHYESESTFMELVYRKINSCLSDIELVISKTNSSPYNL